MVVCSSRLRLADERRVCSNDVKRRTTFRFPPKDLDLNWREEAFSSAFARGRQEANIFASATEALDYDTVTRQAAKQAVNAGDYRVLTSKIDGAPQQSMVTCDVHRHPTVHSMPIVSYTTVQRAPPPFLQTSSRIYDVSQTLPSTDAEPSWKQPPLERIVAFAPCSSTNIMVSRATQTGEPPASSVSAKDAINHDVEVKHSPVSSVVSEKSKNVLKLEKFSGKGSLQVFLKRFDICSRHNGWSPSDRKDHLMISLTDSAAQLIWESSEIETAEDLIKRLEDRFGLKYQQAVYRVQLENRRQGPGETLSSLMTDIRRLLALAYPTEHSDLHETIAIRSYINALYDRELAISVSERDPEQLQEAYKISVRLQTYRQAELESGRSGQRNKPRVQFVREADRSTGAGGKSMEERMQAVEKALKSTPPVDYARPTYPPSCNYMQPPQVSRAVSQDARISGNARNVRQKRRCWICYGDDHLSFQCGARNETRVKDSYGAPLDYNRNSAYDGRQRSRTVDEQGAPMSARTSPEPLMSARVG